MKTLTFFTIFVLSIPQLKADTKFSRCQNAASKLMVDEIDEVTSHAIDEFYSDENTRYFDKVLQKRMWPIGTRLYSIKTLDLPGLAETGLDSSVKLFHLEESAHSYDEYIGKIGIGIVSVRIFNQSLGEEVKKTIELYNSLKVKNVEWAQLFHNETLENGKTVIIKNYIPGPRPEDLISLMKQRQLSKRQMIKSFDSLKDKYAELAGHLIESDKIRNEFFHHANKILDKAIDGLYENKNDEYWNKILDKIDSLYLYYFPGHLAPVSVHDFKYYNGEWILSSL